MIRTLRCSSRLRALVATISASAPSAQDAISRYATPIPPGLFVCHDCDNPECCNPYHLVLGTASDNAQDREDKRRRRRDTVVTNAKLTADAVREIRRLRAARVRIRQLAHMYAVTERTIERIVAGTMWRHIRP
jgi:hypothetical protein